MFRPVESGRPSVTTTLNCTPYVAEKPKTVVGMAVHSTGRLLHHYRSLEGLYAVGLQIAAGSPVHLPQCYGA